MARGNYQAVKQYDGRQTAPQRQDSGATVAALLQQNLRALASVLPRHITPERMARVSLSTIRRTPELMQVAPETLVMAIIEASTLGLEIDSRGLAYLVPFFNKKTGKKEAQLIPGYKGLIELAYRSGKIQSIQAAVVGENDTFDYALGLKPRLEHVPDLRDPGKTIAAYAIAILKDGAAQFEVMSLAELEKVRKAAKASYGPWVDWTDQMYIKTVIKRLCKLLPLSPEIQRVVALDDAVDAGVSQVFGETLDESLINIPAPTNEVAPAPAIEQETEDGEPPFQPEQQEPVAAEAQAPAGVDTSYTFRCPHNGKDVTEADCTDCKMRPGCPEWETA